MTLDEIKKSREETPFEPFELCLADGRVLHIPHRDFIWIPPGSKTWIYVSDGSSPPEKVNAVLVVSIRPAKGKKPSRRRKAG